MSERPHRKLMKCHVLFLGDSTPEQTTHGLQSLQEPLMKCYPVDSPTQVEGIDSWLTVFTSGILLQYVSNKNDSAMPIWFPIQQLHLAAATKCINYLDRRTGQRMETEFVDINNPTAKNSSHPPLYSIIVRKTSGKRVLRCYTFLVKDEYPAEMLVDAAKYAFTNKSGWSDTHPPEQLIRAEIIPGTDDPDDVDQFDSVSAAGRRSNLAGNQSQSDTDTDRIKSPFPAHLVKKYTLSSASRGTGLPGSTSPRRPIPREFMPASSMRSIHSGVRVGHPSIPYQMMDGSIRTTSSVRIVSDPRTRAPVVERVIREEIPVAVPVYQPPPPPWIIEHVKPVYIPQPPEIRHVPVEREVPVPVPVPYHVEPPYQESYSKRSSRHKSHKHHTFKNYQVYDDRFTRPDYDRSSFFAKRGEPINFSASPQGVAVPPNFNYRAAGEFYQFRGGQNRKSRGRRYSSSGESSDEEDRRRPPPREYHPRNGGIEIIELNSHDERSKSDSKGNRREHDRNSKDYHIREVERKTNVFNINEVNNNGVTGPEFKWSAMPSSSSRQEKQEEKADKQKRSARKSRDESSSPERGRVYVGAEPVEKSRSSYHLLGDSVIEELKQKGKGKKKREKTVEEYPDYNGASTSKEYYFKEQTEAPPRNWMDQKKEYMNERAFSSSLVNDPDSNITNAYALNREPEDDTMLDRSIGGGIPVPPPLPADMKAAAGMY